MRNGWSACWARLPPCGNCCWPIANGWFASSASRQCPGHQEKPTSSTTLSPPSPALVPTALTVRHRGGMDVPAVAAAVRNRPAAPVIGAAAALRTAGGHAADHEQLAGGQPEDGPAEKERRTSAHPG